MTSAAAKNLAATLDLLELNGDGSLEVPSHTTHTVIEIGSNGHSLLWETPFAYRVPGIKPGVPIKNQSHGTPSSKPSELCFLRSCSER